MGRYHPAQHDSFIRCKETSCGTKNAPKGVPAYENECWRCGKTLDEKPDVGDVVTVDIVDEDDNGNAVGKTVGGFVLFLDDDVIGIETTVEVVEVSSNFGHAEIIQND